MDSATTLQCQNLTCLSPNALTSRFCEKCGNPLVKRYLWILDDGWAKNYYRPNSLIDHRYLVRSPSVVLDTKPALSPQLPEEIPEKILPYLKLMAYRSHVPQIYGYVPSADPSLTGKMDLWLLEYGSVPTNGIGELLYPDFLPKLTSLWGESSILRQFNRLWQMAKLWQPLQKRGVVSSLLMPELLRVNGGLVQLLELEKDRGENPDLGDLGALWQTWSEDIQAEGRDYFDSLCQRLQTGDIDRVEELVDLLDRAIDYYGKNQKLIHQVYTLTDTGPAREHNEDACYPKPGDPMIFENGTRLLAIVCDGIGGQEGGEIASALAIETLTEELKELSADREQPFALGNAIEHSIRVTNDVICERNDTESRLERQRMGTTLVMSVASDREMYAAHVGDSRVYWLTEHSCHQITVDDDLASREVKLGYLFYRDAIQYPNAGALVQALGMSTANHLHPTVSKFIVDEDCVFLLCSDGLSDHDRVEQYWESEIVPLLRGEKTIQEVGGNLLEIANQKNGHDNTTIALIYCQVQAATSVLPPLDLEDNYGEEMESTSLEGSEDESEEELPTVLSVAPAGNFPPPPVRDMQERKTDGEERYPVNTFAPEEAKQGNIAENKPFNFLWLALPAIIVIVLLGWLLYPKTPEPEISPSSPAPALSPSPGSPGR